MFGDIDNGVLFIAGCQVRTVTECEYAVFAESIFVRQPTGPEICRIPVPAPARIGVSAQPMDEYDIPSRRGRGKNKSQTKTIVPWRRTSNGARTSVFSELLLRADTSRLAGNNSITRIQRLTRPLLTNLSGVGLQNGSLSSPGEFAKLSHSRIKD